MLLGTHPFLLAIRSEPSDLEILDTRVGSLAELPAHTDPQCTAACTCCAVHVHSTWYMLSHHCNYSVVVYVCVYNQAIQGIQTCT